MHFDPHCTGEKLLPQWSPVVPFSCCVSWCPMLYRSPVVFLDRGHPRFGNFNSAIPVDVIRVKSYVDSFLDLT